MFENIRRRRLMCKIAAVLMSVVVLTLGVWLNLKDDVDDNLTEKTVKEIKQQELENSQADETAIDNKRETTEKETDTYNVAKSYLVKEVNGVVKVYILNDDGTRSLYLTTSIPFRLLSENDQKLFEDGVIINTEDDLGSFLENFDS